jgi:hypothetical protein
MAGAVVVLVDLIQRQGDMLDRRIRCWLDAAGVEVACAGVGRGLRRD